MTTKYVVMNFRFDDEKWSETLKTIRTEDMMEFSQVIGVDRSTLVNWRNRAHKGAFPHPSMSNFIKACNWLDVDPRDYFTL